MKTLQSVSYLEVKKTVNAMTPNKKLFAQVAALSHPSSVNLTDAIINQIMLALQSMMEKYVSEKYFRRNEHKKPQKKVK